MPLADLPATITAWDSPRREQVGLFRDYYDGNHRLGFASPRFRQRYKWLLQQSRENLMPAVVKAFTDLKRIEAWTAGEAMDDATEMGMSRLAGLVHRDEFRCGDAFTLTWLASDGKPRAVFQRPDQIVPHVDPENPDVLDQAARVWVDGQYGRANIYWPDRVERFITRLPVTDKTGGRLRDMPDVEIGWAPFDGDGQPDTIRHDFGAVPICWWKRDADDQWAFGRSVLSDAIPVQDELNYQVAVTNAAIERMARPIRYALVSSPEIVGAANGKVDFDPTREDVLTLTANSAGEFTGPNGDTLVALQNHAEQKIARVVGIPPYVFSQASGEVPSGVSLRIVNERRTATVRASNDDDTPAWRGQMALLGFDDCQPQWADPMSLTEQEAAELAVVEKQDLGLPARLWLRTAGYDPDATNDAGVRLEDEVANIATVKAQDISQAFLNGTQPATYPGA